MGAMIRGIQNIVAKFSKPFSSVALVALFFAAWLVALWVLICVVRVVLG